MTCSFDLAYAANTSVIPEAKGSWSEFVSACPLVPDRKEFSPAYIGATSFNSGKSLNAFFVHYYGANASAPFGVSCDIDTRVYFTWELSEDAATYSIFGMTWGDRFPANNTYIIDEKGTVLILGASGVDSELKTTAPYAELCGDGTQEMQTWSFDIVFRNENGMNIFDKVRFGN